ncbi:small acid-soluble spore protein SspJ [Metabacillus arenae]|uniref:Small, acid-soluble spore protein, SspJ family n=1 Tax=Metabacillus arenae TaxID=2771434 RepID=A0A926RWX7_9BACI|nr:small acid-soluble spore protein SspJ [Metabacillus arenae]MBD1379592.1 small, acid-soluble spore protein, SspJ family [Metabacillus arenae]
MFGFGKDRKKERKAPGVKDASAMNNALNEAEKALEGDPLQEAVKKKQN